MPIVMTLLPDRPITFVVSCPTHFKLITVVSDAAVRLRDLKFVAEGCACNLGWSLVQLVAYWGQRRDVVCSVLALQGVGPRRFATSRSSSSFAGLCVIVSSAVSFAYSRCNAKWLTKSFALTVPPTCSVAWRSTFTSLKSVFGVCLLRPIALQ